MRVVSVQAWMRSSFTANELSGWPSGIQYSPGTISFNETLKERRAKEASKPREQVEPVQIQFTSLLK